MAQRFSPASMTGYIPPGTLEGTITITADEYGKIGYFRAGEPKHPDFNTTTFNTDGSVTFVMSDTPNWVTR